MKEVMEIVSAIVDRKKEAAVAHVMTAMHSMYGEAVRNLQLDHVDEAGYWFSYELIQSAPRQVWCVRPWEV